MSAPDTVAAGTRRTRVMLVDDSPLALEILRRMLATAPDLEVVGVASDGLEALRRIPEVAPDVICTDYHMPGLDGLGLIREVMQRHPLPILVMSTSVQPGQQQNIFAMLEAGAVDILAKPAAGMGQVADGLTADLVEKIRVLRGVKVFRRRRPGGTSSEALPAAAMVPVEGRPEIIGIGASTGGPQALEMILSALPRDFPVPLVCVQHMAPGFSRGLADWLAASCALKVVQPDAGTLPSRGHVYMAPEACHLEIDECGRFRHPALPPVHGHRPAVDVTFRSLARRFGNAAAGVLLTGMGRDGADGLLAIRRAGGQTMAQDEASSVVFGMPREAIRCGAAATVLGLDGIAARLCRWTEEQAR